MNIQNLEAINRVLYHIHTATYLDFRVESLAKLAGYSRFHFTRLFHEIFGESVSEYLLRFRLEFAALKILQNRDKKMTDISYEAGFNSSATFNLYFKKHFKLSPKKWREEKYKEFEQKDFSAFRTIEYKIKKIPPIGVLYLRHKGYDESIKKVWQNLLVCLNHDIQEVQMIGVHHNYPFITPKSECHYVACIKSDKIELQGGKVGFGYTNKGYYAIFSFEGKKGDILAFMDYLYLEWLHKSGYESDTRVPMVFYKKNHFLSEDEKFDIDFYLPIKHF